MSCLARFEVAGVLALPYPIYNIEVTQPVPPLSLSDGDTGVALILRFQGKPIDFLMEALPSHRDVILQRLYSSITAIANQKELAEGRQDEKNISEGPNLFPSLTIAICTRNRSRSLHQCLKSLPSLTTHFQTVKSPIEILVVDNNPSDNQTIEVVQSFPEVRYVCEPLPGLSTARNLAIKEAKGELLAFIDDDVVVDSGWLSGLVEAWEQNPTAAAFTGQVLPYELVSEAQVMFERRGGFRRGFTKKCYDNPANEHKFFPLLAWTFGVGANMVFRKEILKKLGGFDQALGAGTLTGGGEELDMFYRILRAGYSLQYDPAFLVFHKHRREMNDLRFQYWTWGMGFTTFLGKTYRTDPPFRLKVIQLMVQWITKDLWQVQKSVVGCHALPPAMILAELWGGIQGLFGGYARSKRQVEKIHTQLVPSPAKKS